MWKILKIYANASTRSYYQEVAEENDEVLHQSSTAANTIESAQLPDIKIFLLRISTYFTQITHPYS